ncbi:MAG TPA: hypothetical protein VHP12_04690 [Chitinophagaceae bacterium]|nr:hypothetical protein [Chitinophagaceae bacterium]
MLKKYIPFIIFLSLLLLSWLIEMFIGEGHLSNYNYLYLTEHKFLRFCIKGSHAFLFFCLGYVGLSQLSVQWAKTLWLYWYAIAFFVAAVRVVLDIILGHYLNENIVSVLGMFYYLNITPIPYFVLLVLAMIAKRKQENR